MIIQTVNLSCTHLSWSLLQWYTNKKTQHLAICLVSVSNPSTCWLLIIRLRSNSVQFTVTQLLIIIRWATRIFPFIYTKKLTRNFSLKRCAFKLNQTNVLTRGVRVMVFNATFNNISVISWCFTKDPELLLL